MEKEDWKQEENFLQGVEKARRAKQLRQEADALEKEAKGLLTNAWLKRYNYVEKCKRKVQNLLQIQEGIRIKKQAEEGAATNNHLKYAEAEKTVRSHIKIARMESKATSEELCQTFGHYVQVGEELHTYICKCCGKHLSDDEYWYSEGIISDGEGKKAVYHGVVPSPDWDISDIHILE